MTALLDVPRGDSGHAADAEQVRTAARMASSAAERFEAAAERLERRTSRTWWLWRGDAAAAARQDLEQLQSRARATARAHESAADALSSCAVRLDRAHELHQRAQALVRQDDAERAARAAAAARGAFVSPYAEADTSLLRHAARLADEARQTSEDAVARASQQLRELAACAPGDGPRPLTAEQQVSGFFGGAVNAVWSSVVTAAELSVPRMLLDPRGWREQVSAVGDGVAYAAEHPQDAALALVGWDALEQGRYGEWAGALLPDVIGAVVSGGALPVTRRGVTLTDDLAELAEGTGDLQRVHDRRDGDLRPGGGGPVVPQPGAVMTPRYPKAIQDLVAERRTHILDGDPPTPDRPSSGGHRSGVGRPGKTEFPPEWSDELIITRVMDTARQPARTDTQTLNENLVAFGEYDGVRIKVVVDPAGHVVTAHPLDGPGVVKNPWKKKAA